MDNNILDISVLPVPTHKKRNNTIIGHDHFDIRYLLETDDNAKLKHAKQEVSDIKWFEINEVQKFDIDIMPIIKRVMKKVEK